MSQHHHHASVEDVGPIFASNRIPTVACIAGAKPDSALPGDDQPGASPIGIEPAGNLVNPKRKAQGAD